MKLQIEIETNNSAFEGDGLRDEIDHCLKQVSYDRFLYFGSQPVSVRDFNGNTVGHYTFSE